MGIGETKEDILVNLKYTSENIDSVKKELLNSKNKINDINRDITAKTLKMQKTISKGWKTRFKTQIFRLKEQRLMQQRNSDVLINGLNQQVEIKKKYIQLNKRLTQHSKAQARQEKASMKMGGAQKILEQVNAAQRLANAWDSVGGALKMPVQHMKRMHENGVRFNKTSSRMIYNIRMMTHGLHRFRMEMLGVMFFGMSMSMMFSSMLRPAMEAAGIFEIWGATLQVVFLPIVIALLPLFIKLTDTLMSLSKESKIMVGTFAILGFVLGKLLFLVGTLALGIGSLLQTGFFAKIAGFFSSLGAGMTIGLGSLILILGIIIALAIGVYTAFKENFGGIRDWFDVLFVSLTEYIDGVKKVFKGLWDVVVGLFTGDFDKFKSGFKTLIEGINQMIIASIKMATSAITILVLGAWRMIFGIISTVIGAVEWLVDLIPGISVDGWDEGFNNMVGINQGTMADTQGMTSGGTSVTNIGTYNTNNFGSDADVGTSSQDAVDSLSVLGG